MKRILLSLLFIISTVICFSQNEHETYCELVGAQKILSTKVTVQVNFGQSKWENAYLYDEKGKKISFNSMMGALNYMAKRGWKLNPTLPHKNIFVDYSVCSKIQTSDFQTIYFWNASKSEM